MTDHYRHIITKEDEEFTVKLPRIDRLSWNGIIQREGIDYELGDSIPSETAVIFSYKTKPGDVFDAEFDSRRVTIATPLKTFPVRPPDDNSPLERIKRNWLLMAKSKDAHYQIFAHPDFFQKLVNYLKAELHHDSYGLETFNIVLPNREDVVGPMFETAPQDLSMSQVPVVQDRTLNAGQRFLIKRIEPKSKIEIKPTFMSDLKEL
jgi:hypothetical protein